MYELSWKSRDKTQINAIPFFREGAIEETLGVTTEITDTGIIVTNGSVEYFAPTFRKYEAIQMWLKFYDPMPEWELREIEGDEV